MSPAAFLLLAGPNHHQVEQRMTCANISTVVMNPPSLTFAEAAFWGERQREIGEQTGLWASFSKAKVRAMTSVERSSASGRRGSGQ